MTKKVQADMSIENCGSILLFQPLTLVGEQWINDHVTPNSLRYNGALVVEGRYAADLAVGMQEDGLAVC